VQTSINACAREVVEVIPLAMREIRTELRKHGAQELSVPQFRTLNFLNRHRGASLSEVAEHIGLSLPSMSTLVDGLVVRNLAKRRPDSEDRRRMTLELTDRGEATLRASHEATEAYLAELLGHLSPQEKSTVINAMRILRSVFAGRSA